MSIEKLKEMLKNCYKEGKSPFYCVEVGDIFMGIMGILKTQSTQIADLKAKVKHLEQQQTYYPFSEEELLREPLGGTD